MNKQCRNIWVNSFSRLVFHPFPSLFIFLSFPSPVYRPPPTHTHNFWREGDSDKADFFLLLLLFNIYWFHVDSLVGWLLLHCRHETPVLAKPIRVIHVDKDIVVLDKPGSLPVSGSFRERRKCFFFFFLVCFVCLVWSFIL